MTRFIFIASWIALSALEARAQTYEDAQAELAAAYSDYYRQLKRKKSFTQKEAEELASSILAPANAKVAKAMQEDSTRVKREAADFIGPAAPNSSARVEGKVEKAPSPVVRIPASKSEPETAIDGSNVPKELEFPGKLR